MLGQHNLAQAWEGFYRRIVADVCISMASVQVENQLELQQGEQQRAAMQRQVDDLQAAVAAISQQLQQQQG